VKVRATEKELAFNVNAECIHDRFFIGDPNRIRQAVLNLCSNAVKFTDSGSVTLEVLCHDTDDAATERLEMSVIDTGIGIAEHKQGHIFEKFEQADNSISRKFGGTGLGLAITKSLIEAMGGEISVTSALGQGSTFTINLVLPKAGAPGDTVDCGNAQLGNSQNGKVILLVEDHEPNILVAETFLNEFGFAVEIATNGQDAVEMTKSRRDYALVLMDVQMHGMNGLDATKLIRAHEAANDLTPLPIIGMTAHALSGDRERCLAAGMDDYISKPFDAAVLEQKIGVHAK
jgi:CheY-like chemotaxis protein